MSGWCLIILIIIITLITWISLLFTFKKVQGCSIVMRVNLQETKCHSSDPKHFEDCEVRHAGGTVTLQTLPSPYPTQVKPFLRNPLLPNNFISLFIPPLNAKYRLWWQAVWLCYPSREMSHRSFHINVELLKVGFFWVTFIFSQDSQNAWTMTTVTYITVHFTLQPSKSSTILNIITEM